ncbi:hypothetical protein [Actinoplanes sp. NBRC 103695]|uniref:hypothetical protein n=1 Tax=Actinoplanes sp. NBRC 103695 TaxID=3032202 RepID=UPI0024A5DDD8|nr:hypothetical protein [Actinoplanes sp. NBRC 103695]GLY93858.1 hypothetical protein Acsp02_11140 [Actinoplanes sp. NBRC 103695]
MSSAYAEAAVDRYEVAAALEADGITDATARDHHAADDVFDLADRLFREAPREPQPNRPAESPWRATPVTHVLRGVLFGLPALAYLSVADRLSGPRSAVLLVVSVLLSWATGQGLAHLGQLRRSQSGHAGAAGVLGGAALAAGLPAVAIVAGLGFALGVPLVVTLIAAGQLAYVLAATVALVLGREWWLLAALAAGLVTPIAGVAAAIVVACWSMRGVRPQLPTRAELTAALPAGTFGVLVGALLIFTPALRALDPQPGHGTGVAVALAVLLPLSVSMGAAEWLLFRYRAATHRAMAESRNFRSFGRRASTALFRATAGYVAVLVALLVAGIVLTGELPHLEPVLIGPALFLALLLMSFDIRRPVVLACLAALTTNLALIPLHAPETVQAGTAAGLLVALYVYAARTLRRAQFHL